MAAGSSALIRPGGRRTVPLVREWQVGVRAAVTGEESELDRYLNGQAARLARVFTSGIPRFPAVAVHGDRNPADRISGHSSPATRARDDGNAEACCTRSDSFH